MCVTLCNFVPLQSVTPPPTLPKSPAVAQRQHQLHLQQYQAQMTVTGADGEGVLWALVNVCVFPLLVTNLDH